MMSAISRLNFVKKSRKLTESGLITYWTYETASSNTMAFLEESFQNKLVDEEKPLEMKHYVLMFQF